MGGKASRTATSSAFAALTSMALMLGLGAPAISVPMDYPPAPTPTASATPAPTGTPTPTASATATSSPGAEPSEIATPTRTGIVTINGVNTNVVITANAAAGTYTITGGGIALTLSAVGPAGVRLPLGAGSVLIIIPGGNLVVTGTGFAPNSVIYLWLLSTPLALGQWTTDGSGSFRATATLPAGLAPGRHHAQVLGTGATGQELRASIPLFVAAGPFEAVRKRLSTTVWFDPLVSTLSPAQKARLDRLIAQIPPGSRKVRITVAGYVQASSSTANDLSLSTARSQAVAAYLRSRGVRGTYVVAGRGISSAPGASARNAHVRIVLTILR